MTVPVAEFKHFDPADAPVHSIADRAGTLRRHDLDVERVIASIDVVFDADVGNYTRPWPSHGRSCQSGALA
jgi:hypothetical protein